VTVAIHQPQYFPWIAYFDKMDQVDIFIYLDNVQFCRRGLQHRNKIKTPQGALWLTVPVSNPGLKQINEVIISEQSWKSNHLKNIKNFYAKTIGLDFISKIFDQFKINESNLSELNIFITELLCNFLNIKCKRIRASDLGVKEVNKQENIIALIKKVNGTTYLSGRGAKVYQDTEIFDKNNILLKYQHYKTQKYKQKFSSLSFNGDLSIIDLICNEGGNSKNVLLAGRNIVSEV